MTPYLGNKRRQTVGALCYLLLEPKSFQTVTAAGLAGPRLVGLPWTGTLLVFELASCSQAAAVPRLCSSSSPSVAVFLLAFPIGSSVRDRRSTRLHLLQLSALEPGDRRREDMEAFKPQRLHPPAALSPQEAEGSAGFRSFPSFT
ncbi:hypothetical protein AOLI_G00212530 [Acnodon oligacanthus]